jgi:hypothetical protein
MGRICVWAGVMNRPSSAFSDYVDRMDCADFAVFASPSMSPNAAVGHDPVTPSSYDFNWTSAFGTLCFRHQLHRRTFASGFLSHLSPLWSHLLVKQQLSMFPTLMTPRQFARTYYCRGASVKTKEKNEKRNVCGKAMI